MAEAIDTKFKPTLLPKSITYKLRFVESLAKQPKTRFAQQTSRHNNDPLSTINNDKKNTRARLHA
jgi:hypothetical protein